MSFRLLCLSLTSVTLDVRQCWEVRGGTEKPVHCRHDFGVLWITISWFSHQTLCQGTASPQFLPQTIHLVDMENCHVKQLIKLSHGGCELGKILFISLSLHMYRFQRSRFGKRGSCRVIYSVTHLFIRFTFSKSILYIRHQLMLQGYNGFLLQCLS